VTRNPAWVDLLWDSSGLTGLYDSVPPLDGILLSSLHFDQMGPTLTLRFVLPSFPDRPLPAWEAAGCDRFECQLQFLGVEDVTMRGWRPPVTADVLIEPTEPAGHHRILIEVRGHDGSAELRFTSNSSLGAGQFNAYREGTAARHHAGRVNPLAYGNRLPDPSEKTFYERF